MRTIYLLFAFQISIACNAQQDYFESIKTWQKELNTSFKNPDESPLPPKELKKFTSLEFYDIDSSYCIKAAFRRTPDEKPFMMATTTQRKPLYVKYGIATFTRDGKEFSISIYQSLQLRQTQQYKDHLFAPFTDLTSGNESYGGGRYIDLTVPTDENHIIIDFNKAYNPYCAYNENYSCPIPPRENDIEFEIKAGVKSWKNH